MSYNEQRTRRPKTRTALGVTLILVAAVLGLGGAYAAVMGYGGGYLDLGANGHYRTEQYALATETTDWEATFLGWAGSVKVEVAPDGAEPTFVGVAPPEAIGDYLDQVAHTVVAEGDSGDVVVSDHAGGPLTTSADAIDWTARAEGVGAQTLRWSATDGPQVVVAARADGSPGVAVEVMSSAITLERMPWWLPAVTLGLGILSAVAGARLLLRRRTGGAGS